MAGFKRAQRELGLARFDDEIGGTGSLMKRALFQAHSESKMPKRCVVWNCNNISDKGRDIKLHIIPFYGDERPIAGIELRNFLH